MKFVIPIVLLPFAALPLSAAATGSATCHDGEQYRVIAKPAESAGHHFITRKKMPGDDGKPCLYSVEPGDFEIRNKNAAHFLALAGSLLILDSGTAPEPRDLILWDVKKRIKVYSGTYSPPPQNRGQRHLFLATKRRSHRCQLRAGSPLAGTGSWRCH